MWRGMSGRRARLELTKQPGFEMFEVTADVGVLAWGDSLEEPFANAASGLFALMVEPRTAR